MDRFFSYICIRKISKKVTTLKRNIMRKNPDSLYKTCGENPTTSPQPNLSNSIQNATKIQDFIREQSKLFWYTPEEQKKNISKEFLVETILNYGDLKAVKQLINLLGIKTSAQIFFDSIHMSDRRKGNYHELTINYFTLFFNRYAH